MRLKQNSKAPDFSTIDYLGQEVELSEYKGKKVLLSFFRVASCPFCNLRVHELIKNQQELNSRGIKIITFFLASKDEIHKYAGKLTPPFPVIPDPEFLIYKKYGVESSLSGMFKAMFRMGTMVKMMIGGFFNMKSVTERPLLPADFLIDENGVIYKTHYGSDFGDHIDLKDVLIW